MAILNRNFREPVQRISFSVGVILSFFVVVGVFFPRLVFAEVILNFDAIYDVRTDGSVLVTEEIVYDFGNTSRHGIFRSIPTTHPQAASVWYKDRYMDIEVLSVLRDGNSEAYELTNERDQLFLKIGDPDKTIQGSHTYTINYTLQGALSYFDKGDAEFYWNVTGDEWTVAIENTQATIKGDTGVLLPRQYCYEGVNGSTAKCTVEQLMVNGSSFRSKTLTPGTQLTIAKAVDAAKVDQIVLERVSARVLWLLSLIMWFAGLGIYAYRYRTRYRTNNPIIPQYEPYEGFKPMYSGVLIDGTLHPRDITACIVYLAQQGFIKIKKIESKVLFLFEVDDYEIMLLRSMGEVESKFQSDVLGLLFTFSDIGQTITLGELKKDKLRRKSNYFKLRQLKRNLESDLEKEGFYDNRFSRSLFSLLIYAPIFVFLLISSIDFVSSKFDYETVVFMFVFIIITSIILTFLHRRRTQRGYEAVEHLKGFKQFLSVTEKERYAFHNAPEKSPEQFMEFLPYAIAFGVEEAWADVFKDITIPDPDWYDGGTSAVGFSAVNLTNSLGAFSTAFTSSSGSSGSSGGGSAGGGGGGGGGGSW